MCGTTPKQLPNHGKQDKVHKAGDLLDTLLPLLLCRKLKLRARVRVVVELSVVIVDFTYVELVEVLGLY